tara:strand:- start:162 stop:710 length:549 start_codon:yes stop_codon:yes gene_type:complete
MKKHIKYFVIIFTSIFLFSCGFTPLYKSESTNFYISEIKTNSDNAYFNIFKSFMSQYEVKKDNANNYNLDVNLQKSKETLSKDASGNPLVYMITISSNISISNYEKIISKKKFKKKFKYNHNSSIFDLNLYEKEIEKKLIKQIVDQLIITIIGLDENNSMTKANTIKIDVNANSVVGYTKGS